MCSKLPFTISLLNENYLYLLDNFKCGNDEIDRYIKEDAYNNQFIGEGVTFLVLNENEDKLIAYYTLTSTSLIYSTITDNKDYEPRISGIPAIEIKIFAVNKAYQNIIHHSDKFGDKVLSDIILGSLIADVYKYSCEILGIQIIMLYSTDEGINFYTRNSFEKLDDYIPLYDKYTEDCTPMYLRLF